MQQDVKVRHLMKIIVGVSVGDPVLLVHQVLQVRAQVVPRAVLQARQVHQVAQVHLRRVARQVLALRLVHPLLARVVLLPQVQAVVVRHLAQVAHLLAHRVLQVVAQVRVRARVLVVNVFVLNWDPNQPIVKWL